MQLAMCMTLCVVLLISTTSANVIPTDTSAATEPLSTVESSTAGNAVPKDTSKSSTAMRTDVNSNRNHTVQQDLSDAIHFPNKTVSELGDACELNGVNGICTEFFKCLDCNKDKKCQRSENDPCENTSLLKSLIICCSNGNIIKGSPDASTTTEESSTVRKMEKESVPDMSTTTAESSTVRKMEKESVPDMSTTTEESSTDENVTDSITEDA